MPTVNVREVRLKSVGPDRTAEPMTLRSVSPMSPSPKRMRLTSVTPKRRKRRQRANRPKPEAATGIVAWPAPGQAAPVAVEEVEEPGPGGAWRYSEREEVYYWSEKQLKSSFIHERIEHMLPELYYMLADHTGPIHEGRLHSQAAWHAEANARDAESKDESGDEEDDPGAGQAAPHAGGGSPAGAGEAAPPAEWDWRFQKYEPVYYWSQARQEIVGGWIEERLPELYYKLENVDGSIHESFLQDGHDLLEAYEEVEGHEKFMEQYQYSLKKGKGGNKAGKKEGSRKKALKGGAGSAGASGAEEAGGGREEGSGGASGAMEGVTEEGGGAGQAAPQAKKAPRPILKKEGAAPAQAARPKGRVVVEAEATGGVITRELGKPLCPSVEAMSRFFQ